MLHLSIARTGNILVDGSGSRRAAVVTEFGRVLFWDRHIASREAVTRAVQYYLHRPGTKLVWP